MHIFRADRAAVGLLERGNQLAELHGVFANSKRPHVEGFLEIRFGEVVEGRIEIRNAFLLPQPQRVKVRLLMPTETVGVDQLQDFDLFRIGVRVGNGRGIT